MITKELLTFRKIVKNSFFSFTFTLSSYLLVGLSREGVIKELGVGVGVAYVVLKEGWYFSLMMLRGSDGKCTYNRDLRNIK